jgi:hypothetical protein
MLSLLEKPGDIIAIQPIVHDCLSGSFNGDALKLPGTVYYEDEKKWGEKISRWVLSGYLAS